MPWRGHNATHCRVCGGAREDVGRMSARYKCQRCAILNVTENLEQLHAHNGPRWKHWRVRCLAAFGVVTDTDE